MFDDQPWYFNAAGGAVIGLLIGVAFSSGGDDDKVLDARLAAFEESIATKLAESSAATSAALAGLAEGNEVLKAEVAVVGVALAEGIGNLGEQNVIIGEAQVALGEQVEEMASAPAAPAAVSVDSLKAAMAAVHAEHKARHHGKGGASSEETPEPTAAAPESEAPSDPAAAVLADKIGADGIIASAGQTAVIGDGRLFISRVAGDVVSALVVGGDSVEMSVFGGEVEVGGCVVILEGIAGDAAYLRPAC